MIIIISELKPYTFIQTNDHYKIEMITWNHMVMYRLLLDRNTWNYTTVYKLFVLSENTWYHISVCKKTTAQKM